MLIDENKEETPPYVANHEAGACRPFEGDVQKHLREVLAARAEQRFTPMVQNFLDTAKVESVYLAGGAMLHGPANDLDLWPTTHRFHSARFREHFLERGGKEGFAPTVALFDGTKVQLVPPRDYASWTPEPLRQLVASFDFAHCQVGATMAKISKGWHCHDVAYTSAWRAAMLTQGTFFVNPNWVKHSLSRIPRVAQKLDLDKDETFELARQVSEKLIESATAEGMKRIQKPTQQSLVQQNPTLGGRIY